MNLHDVIGNPIDYFDFPFSMYSFGKSLKSSKLVSKKVESGYIFFREYGKTLTLVNYTCNPYDLKKYIERVKKIGKKVKCLNFVNKPMDGFEKISYGKEYYVEGDYDFDFGWMKSKSRSKLRNKLRNSEKSYYVDYDFSYEEFKELFDKWFNAAQERHFMVVKGHYLAYAKLYFETDFDYVHMLGIRKKENNELYAVSGFEVFNSKVQMTVMKHQIGDNYFPKWFWITVLKEIFKFNPEKVFCGTTADALKSELGMKFEKSYKLKL